MRKLSNNLSERAPLRVEAKRGERPVGAALRNRATRARRVEPGFSLVELMIATVILGIGLVMVATIFPVAVEQTRNTVQQSIVQTVADSAEQTLRLRMRSVLGTAPIDDGSSDLPGDRPYLSDGGDATDSVTADEPTSPSNYDTDPAALGWQRVRTQHPRFFRVIRVCNMVRPPRDSDNIEFLTPAVPIGSLYDPRTEVMLEGAPQVFSQFVMLQPSPPAPFPPPAYADLSPRVSPHWIGLSVAGRAGTFPRIDVLDRVYPAVRPRWPQNPMNNADSDDNPRYHDLLEAAGRRYSWTALGAPAMGDAGPAGRPYDLRIVVMYKEETSLRYASQHAMFGNLERHLEPTALPTIEDTLFPRPWLVSFDDGNPATFPDTNYTAAPMQTGQGAVLPAGTIYCRNRVGELLPEGAVFLDFERGRAHKVVRNIPAPSNPLRYRRLRVVPDSYANSPNPANINSGMDFWYPDFPDYAWVFPPAVVRTGSGATDYRFEGGCPVMEVFESTIPR